VLTLSQNRGYGGAAPGVTTPTTAQRGWEVPPQICRLHPAGHRRVVARPAHGIDAQHAAELMERRYCETSTVFCTQYSQKDRHQLLGSGVHADATMDRIIDNAIWVERGTYNMREPTALAIA
jgi:hypothetical protein